MKSEREIEEYIRLNPDKVVVVDNFNKKEKKIMMISLIIIITQLLYIVFVK